MKIIKVQGGLGNQMFQYAFGLAQAKNIFDVKLDISFYHPEKILGQHQGLELYKLFDINIQPATVRDACYFLQKKRLADGQINYVLKEGRYYIKEERISEHLLYAIDFNQDDCYFDGYWQHIGYLKGLKMKLLKTFKFSKIIKNDTLNYEILKEIKKKSSVSLHIRRGDYLKTPDLYPLPASYYLKAVKFISRKVAAPRFFIFSDDIDWAMTNFKDFDCVFVNFNHRQNSYKDMQLMSECKHNIIANSSFSWWGAWLNRNPNKIVVAPKKWVRNKFDKSFLPVEWIVI